MSFPLACPRMSSSGDREGGAAATAEKKVKMTVYASCLRLPLWIPAGACPRRLLSGAGMTGLEVTRPMFVIPAQAGIQGVAVAGIAGSARDGLREKGLKAYLKTPRQDASSRRLVEFYDSERPHQGGRPIDTVRKFIQPVRNEAWSYTLAIQSSCRSFPKTKGSAQRVAPGVRQSAGSMCSRRSFTSSQIVLT